MGPGDSKLLYGPTTIIEGKERCDVIGLKSQQDRHVGYAQVKLFDDAVKSLVQLNLVLLNLGKISALCRFLQELIKRINARGSASAGKAHAFCWYVLHA